MYACMYVCMCVCVCLCMYVCMYSCMHVCMYVCTQTQTQTQHTHIHTHTHHFAVPHGRNKTLVERGQRANARVLQLAGHSLSFTVTPPNIPNHVVDAPGPSLAAIIFVVTWQKFSTVSAIVHSYSTFKRKTFQHFHQVHTRRQWTRKIRTKCTKCSWVPRALPVLAEILKRERYR
jgi:hypothetical protein